MGKLAVWPPGPQGPTFQEELRILVFPCPLGPCCVSPGIFREGPAKVEKGRLPSVDTGRGVGEAWDGSRQAVLLLRPQYPVFLGVARVPH